MMTWLLIIVVFAGSVVIADRYPSEVACQTAVQRLLETSSPEEIRAIAGGPAAREIIRAIRGPDWRVQDTLTARCIPGGQ